MSICIRKSFKSLFLISIIASHSLVWKYKKEKWALITLTFQWSNRHVSYWIKCTMNIIVWVIHLKTWKNNEQRLIRTYTSRWRFRTKSRVSYLKWACYIMLGMKFVTLVTKWGTRLILLYYSIEWKNVLRLLYNAFRIFINRFNMLYGNRLESKGN